MSDIRQQVRSFVETNFIVDPALGLKDEDSLLQLQIVDSTGFLELIHFIEDTFGIKVADDEMVPDNLETIENVARFVERKKAG